MQELVGAEYRPIETLLVAQAIALIDMQLQPVDVIMDQKFPQPGSPGSARNRGRTAESQAEIPRHASRRE